MSLGDVLSALFDAQWVQAQIDSHPRDMLVISLGVFALSFTFGVGFGSWHVRRRAGSPSALSRWLARRRTAREIMRRLDGLSDEQQKWIASLYWAGVAQTEANGRDALVLTGLAHMGLVVGQGGLVLTWALDDACRSVLDRKLRRLKAVGGVREAS